MLVGESGLSRFIFFASLGPIGGFNTYSGLYTGCTVLGPYSIMNIYVIFNHWLSRCSLISRHKLIHIFFRRFLFLLYIWTYRFFRFFGPSDATGKILIVSPGHLLVIEELWSQSSLAVEGLDVLVFALFYRL